MDSASAVSKKFKPDEVFEEHPVYHHWLALECSSAAE